jgi:hypothetical protein
MNHAFALQMFLNELAEQTTGHYHCYASTSDVSMLLTKPLKRKRLLEER